MDLILEICFLVAGVSLIISGKIPAGLFSTLFGKGFYSTTPKNARLLGAWLASPLPIVLAVTMTLEATMGKDGAFLGAVFAIFYFFLVAIVSIIVAKKIRQPEPV